MKHWYREWMLIIWYTNKPEIHKFSIDGNVFYACGEKKEDNFAIMQNHGEIWFCKTISSFRKLLSRFGIQISNNESLRDYMFLSTSMGNDALIVNGCRKDIVSRVDVRL